MPTAWKARVRQLKIESYALYLTRAVVAYAFSPIDLIPDPIPILGYLDDLLLVPAGILLARRLIPQAVLTECRAQATTLIAQGKPVNWYAAGVIVIVWLAVVLWLARLLLKPGIFAAW